MCIHIYIKGFIICTAHIPSVLSVALKVLLIRRESFHSTGGKQEAIRGQRRLFPLARRGEESKEASCPESDSTCSSFHNHPRPCPHLSSSNCRASKSTLRPMVTWQPRTCGLGQPGGVSLCVGACKLSSICVFPCYSSSPLPREHRAGCFSSQFPRDYRSTD